jgi:hypothetical protein
MKSFLLCLAALAVGPGLPSSGHAQDAAQPQAAVPPINHCSVLRPPMAASSPGSAPPPAPSAWREANRAVDQAGGWRAYAREAARTAERPAAGAAVRCAEAPR